MKRYYLSHPYSGNEEWNRKDAERIRAELKRRFPNICFINPLGMFEGEEDYYNALGDALELLSVCNGLILCPGWEKSTGCRIEELFAKKLEIRITVIERLFNGEEVYPDEDWFSGAYKYGD